MDRAGKTETSPEGLEDPRATRDGEDEAEEPRTEERT